MGRRPPVRGQKAKPQPREVAPTNLRLYEAVALGLIAIDGHGRVVFANALAQQWLGLTSEQLSDEEMVAAGWNLTRQDGTAISPLQHLADFDRLSLAPPTRELCRLQRAGQQERWLELSAAPLKASGSPARTLLISFRDVTDRYELIRQSEINRTRFDTILETANEGVVVLDRDLRIGYVNRRLCDLLGFSKDELIGRIATELYVDSEDANKAVEAAQWMWNRLEVALPSRVGVWVPHKDGYRLWMLGSASPFYDRHRNLIGSILMLTDLTEQKAMQEILDHLSLHDPLTDLPNRRLFQDRLEQAVAAARR
ncbi:MAG TPA: PAS domain S-box protein, partial [Chloroflexota bacterium]